jgi:hypothetical protein
VRQTRRLKGERGNKRRVRPQIQRLKTCFLSLLLLSLSETNRSGLGLKDDQQTPTDNTSRSGGERQLSLRRAMELVVFMVRLVDTMEHARADGWGKCRLLLL